MYENQFGLKKRPFRASATGTDVFVGPQAIKCMVALKKALHISDAVVSVSGAVGVGKTTLVNRALLDLDANRTVVRVGRMQLGHEDVLEVLLEELAMQRLPAGTIQKFNAFRARLKDLSANNGHVIVVVEDAVRLGADALAELEALTAADAGDSDGANIVLMGDERLQDLLCVPGLARLKQRTRQRQVLAPMAPAEMRGYLNHCFRLAGGHFDGSFAEGSADLLHLLTGGIPRVVNNLVDSILESAAGKGVQRVELDTISRVAADEYGLTAAGFDAPHEVAPALQPAAEPVVSEPVVSEPAVSEPVRSEPIAEAPAEIDANVPELIQDTMPELAVLPQSFVDEAARIDSGDRAPGAGPQPEPEPEELPELVAEPAELPELVAEPEEVPELVAEPDEVPELKAEPEEFPELAAEPEAGPEHEGLPEPVAESRPEAEVPVAASNELPDLSDNPAFAARPHTESHLPKELADAIQEADVEVAKTPTGDTMTVMALDESAIRYPEALSTPAAETASESAAEQPGTPAEAMLTLEPVVETGTTAGDAKVPEWERDPTLAQLRPDIEALELALAEDTGSEPDATLAQSLEAPPAAAEVVPEPAAEAAPPAPESDTTPAPEGVLPAITLDESIKDTIENTPPSAPEEFTAVAGPSELFEKPESRMSNTGMQKIAAGLAKAKTIEDVSDTMAETLFGEEFSAIAAEIIANPPPLPADDEPKPEDEPEIEDQPQPAARVDAAALPVNGSVAEEVSLETSPPGSALNMSATQRLRTLQALNAEARFASAGTNSAGAAPNTATPASSAPSGAVNPIEDQINTSITQTLKALNEQDLNIDVDDDDDDGKKKGGFFSRFRK